MNGNRAGTKVNLEAAQRQYERIRPKYVAFSDGLRVLLAQLCKDESISVDSVSGRAKDTASLIDKFRRKPEYGSLDDIEDKCGVRIVTRYQADIEAVANLIRIEFEVLDEVAHGQQSPDAFGYASRHFIVRLATPRSDLREWRPSSDLVAEIQVRSILQHAWASISHGLDYKTGLDVPSRARRRLFRVAALLETGDELFNSFRDEVEQIREGYKEVVASEDWKSTPLDLDSLSEVWSRLPLQELHDAAVQAGWEAAPEPMTLRTEQTAEWSRSKLVQAAHAAGVRTLGELSVELREIASDEAVLSTITGAIAEIDPTRRVVADPEDVAVLYWMSRLGAERIWGEKGNPWPYIDTLEAAAERVAKGIAASAKPPSST